MNRVKGRIIERPTEKSIDAEIAAREDYHEHLCQRLGAREYKDVPSEKKWVDEQLLICEADLSRLYLKGIYYHISN